MSEQEQHQNVAIGPVTVATATEGCFSVVGTEAASAGRGGAAADGCGAVGVVTFGGERLVGCATAAAATGFAGAGAGTGTWASWGSCFFSSTAALSNLGARAGFSPVPPGAAG